MTDLHIVGIPGSLRRASFNRGLLVAVGEILDGRAELEIVSLAEIPLYNDDVRQAGYPDSVPPDQPFAGKPFGLIGASTGGFGTVRSQLALRQNMLFVEALGYPSGLLISGAARLFDEQGHLTDEETQRKLSEYLDSFLAFVERFRK